MRYITVSFLIAFVLAFFAQFGYTNQANAGPSSANYSYYSDTTKPRKNTATNMDVIVADVCNCIHSFENSLSEKVKAQVINATKNGGLDTIWKYFDRRDQDAYFNEGKKTFDCLKRLEKKYPFFYKL